ncbi:ATP synthase F1 subunit delta [Candidatus Falkowbacteria bacterium]|nr:MAG: ATP synthase F1 subunit delta [Candidatus Falkowbacteria bacterium]
MDITPKQYAAALYDSVKEKKKNNLKAILKEFVKFLAVNNDILKSEKIILEFEKIWNKKNKIVEAEIISADVLDKPTVKLLKEYIAKLSGAEQVFSSQLVEKNLLGGVVVKYGDKIIDGSLKTRLNNLKEEMIK